MKRGLRHMLFSGWVPGGQWGWGWNLSAVQVTPCDASFAGTMSLTGWPCVLVGGNVDLESQAEGKKEAEADGVVRSGPRPIVPYSSMFCLSPTNL